MRRATLLRRDEQQIPRRHAAGDLVGDLEAEVAFQVLDSRGAQLAQAAHVVGVVGVELVDPQKAIDLVAVGEIQPMPVDHRATAQEIPDRGQVTEGEVLVAQLAHRRRNGEHGRGGGRRDRLGRQRSRGCLCLGGGRRRFQASPLFLADGSRSWTAV